MKKLLYILSVLLLLSLLIVGATACDADEEPPTPEHSLTEVKGRRASCTKDGIEDYFVCDDCGRLFSDENGENEIEEPIVIKATGHSEAVDKGVKPTCTEGGLSDGKYCSSCGEVTVERKKLAPTGHTLSTTPTKLKEGSYYMCKNGCGYKRSVHYSELSVRSFNIRLDTPNDGDNAWTYRKANVISYINGEDFDVMCLQEVKTSQYNDIKSGLASRYTIVHYERQGAGSEGLAVIYNNERLNLLEKSMFWLSETPDVQSLGWGASHYRICVNLLLEMKSTGAKIDVYNVHLDHQVEAARVNGIKLILERASVKNYPIVLAGDFNCTTGTETMNEATKTLINTQADAPETELGATHNGYKRIPEGEGKSIDFILVDKRWMSPLSFDIVNKYPSATEFYSDHFAITAKVALDPDDSVLRAYETE